jgi:alpha-glucosidase (family GH31 glycosyl hydrolase)
MNNDVMIGYCWPNDKVAYPDFLNNRTISWWTEQILDYKKNVFNFDALWIDMNEPVF